MRVLLMCVVMSFIVSCASNPRDFKVAEVEEGKGAFYGTFKLIVDGSADVGSCNLIFSDKNEEDQAFINIDKTGFFIGSGKVGQNHLVRVACLNGFSSRIFMIKNDKGIRFTNSGKGKMTYVGDITALYSTKDESKAMYLLGGALAGALAASDAEGKGQRLRFKVENNIKEASKLYRKVVTTEGQLKVKRNLLKLPKASRIPASE